MAMLTSCSKATRARSSRIAGQKSLGGLSPTRSTPIQFQAMLNMKPTKLSV